MIAMAIEGMGEIDQVIQAGGQGARTPYFRMARYEELAAEIIIVDAPGQCPADISVFEYRNAPQDIYPLKEK